MMQNLLPFMTENWELCSALALLLIIYIAVEYRTQGSQGQSLSPQMTALQMNRKNTIVLDIRKEPSYQAGHLTGSIHCNMSQLKKLSQLPGINPAHKKNLKSHTIIVVDDHGTQAAKAAKILKAEEYTTVKILRGGINAWNQEKLPLSKVMSEEEPERKTAAPRSKKVKAASTKE